MAVDQWKLIVCQMKERGIEFDVGLTDAEIAAAEGRFGFRFPPDLREFLQASLPKGECFPDWRTGEESALREWLDMPRQGVLFDVEHNGFWLEEWGARPALLDQARRLVSDLIAGAPKLIPIYNHRMMPDEPCLVGNPVFSVHQTDIIHYGIDLASYLRREFDLLEPPSWPDTIREIRFWNLDRFQAVRWANGPCAFDNSKGMLP